MLRDPLRTALQASPAALRPLSIGELFDRAFTIYVRNVITFASLLFVVVVPLAVIQYFMSRDVLDAYMNLIDAAVKHSATPPDVSKLDAAFSGPGTLALSGIYYLVLLLAFPLANAAVVSGVSRAYLGLPVRFRECYADAIKRWGYVLVLAVLWLILAFGLLFGAIFGIALVAVIIAGLLAGLKTLGIVIGAVLGISLGLAFIGLLIMGYMAFASSFIACVLERTDPVNAFALGFKRVFGRGLLWRSLGVAGAIFLMGFGFGIPATVLAAGVWWLTKSPFLYIAIAQFANVFYLAFAFVIVALYYYDIRIRREGFDIQLLADQLAAKEGKKPEHDQPPTVE